MSNKYKIILVGTAAMILTLGAGDVDVGASQDNSNAKSLRCEVQTSSSRGMITLQGMLYTDKKISGSYHFKVTGRGSSGNSNINQGGEFTAGPDDWVTLGKVMLGKRSTQYDATLKVKINGIALKCSEFSSEEI
ncbi:MAG: hypothetical protein GY761_11350 [Hyphomicrobiales bacterium]|nr:hypothetical protein [Hyphomicrobiales bacterium]